MADLADAIAAALPEGASFPEPTRRPCSGKCGATVFAPGPAWCPACIAKADAIDAAVQDAAALAPALESIPNTWRWAALGDSTLHDRARGVHRELVTTIDRERPWPDGVTITGPAGLGKTSLAAAIFSAWVIGETSKGVDRRALARFVSARMLPAQRVTDVAGYAALVASPFIVLDDVGAEGDMPSARAAVADMLAERHAWERPTIVTTFLDEAGVVARYGDGIARRLFERALLVTLKAWR